jgi:apolipoprotein N-acyltransferase
VSTRLRFVLAVISGGLAVFAFPPFSWWPLALVAWALLFVAVRGSGGRLGFWLGLAQGLLLYSCGLSWFWLIFGPAAVALWLIVSSFSGLACGLIGWAGKRHPGVKWLPLYVALVWSGVEYFRSEWFWLRFPWMTPGLALGPTWLSPLIGVYGAGFLVVLAGELFGSGGRRMRWLGGVLTLGLVMLAVMRPGLVREDGPGIPLMALQSERVDFKSYLQTTQDRAFHDGVILWPEYSVPFEIKDSPNPPQDQTELDALVRDKHAVLVFGTIKNLPAGKHFNVARTLDEGGELGWHAKNRPVHFMDDGEPGQTAVPVATRLGKLGTPICFDCDYTEIIRRMVMNGAEAFTVPIMDAETWTEREHLQHAELFRHRALENGRWFAVAATSGMTQIIDPHGNRVAQLPMMDEGVLEGVIHCRQAKTFFTTYGWRFPWLILGAAGLATFWLRFVVQPSQPNIAAAFAVAVVKDSTSASEL